MKPRTAIYSLRSSNTTHTLCVKEGEREGEGERDKGIVLVKGTWSRREGERDGET
jgi:hypothetical protein